MTVFVFHRKRRDKLVPVANRSNTHRSENFHVARHSAPEGDFFSVTKLFMTKNNSPGRWNEDGIH